MILGHMELEGISGHEGGRLLLGQMYAQQVGGPLPPIAIAPGGKPYFVDSPWHFSISHTRGHVFCALSRQPVGLDAENLGRKLNPALAEKILSPGEMERYLAAPDWHRALLSLWVLKEAQAKLTGQGLRIYPNHTDFSPADPRVREMAGCLVAVVT